MKHRLAIHAPAFVAFSFIAGNIGLLLRHGIHPNLETAVGLLWIAGSYALHFKHRHPVLAPRLNAAGIALGSLCLALSGIHANFIDWHRLRTPLGYIPAASVVGFQHELRLLGHRLAASEFFPARFCGAILSRPFTLGAAINAYAILELTLSAVALRDHGLIAIDAAYFIACFAMPLLDVPRLNPDL
jgi:hypothetical protein